jgi:signal transduction histidine kinase
VFVQARVENGRFLISVSDEGPGIAVGDEHLIFDSFYRGDDGLTRQTTGAGLGLAIARGFVQAHGGEIWVTPLAKGTCFTFSLPLQPEFEDEL